MAFWNPFKNVNVPSLSGAATNCFLITPSDAENLPKAVKGIRILNKGAGFATIHFTDVDGDESTIEVPASSLVYEDIAIAKIFATGTTATDLTIHGLTD